MINQINQDLEYYLSHPTMYGHLLSIRSAISRDVIDEYQGEKIYIDVETKKMAHQLGYAIAKKFKSEIKISEENRIIFLDMQFYVFTPEQLKDMVVKLLNKYIEDEYRSPLSIEECKEKEI